MGGTTTSTRATPRKFLSRKVWFGGVLQPTSNEDGLNGYVAPTQTTTSYRTGARLGSAGLSSLEAEVQGVTDRRSFYSNLKAQSDSEVPEGDTGHPFQTVKQYVTLSHPQSAFYGKEGVPGSDTRWKYTGPVALDGLYFNRPQFVQGASTFSEGFHGPKAIQACAPTNPVADLAVGLAELKREGFPALSGASVWKDGTLNARNAGGEYLNHQFGWMPLLGDIQKTMYAVKNASALITQYQRNAGQAIRRRMDFPITVTEDVYGPHPGYLFNPGMDINTSNGFWIDGRRDGILYESVRSQERIWFSGAFSYHLQDDNSVVNKLRDYEQKANYLFGFRITPEVVWNLAPWSWLADWQVNIGDNIANATRLTSDGLVLRYGYLMCETITDHTCTLIGPRSYSGVTGPYTVTFTTVKKQRVKASPYGFAKNPNSFTSRQWAILGALGLSKAPTSLW
jgi:hypothetical protein